METSSHDWMLTAAERGCLVIADIAGYTQYLRDTELEHAHDVLADLLETVVGRLRPALRIAKLEGDAVFAYALDRQVQGSTLLDTIDETYFAFQSRLRDIRVATTCDCDACRLIPRLNLKFVAHSGRFVRNVVAGSEELTGSDVIVVHRLLKNHVHEEFGYGGYALFTEACVNDIAIDPPTLGMREHRENYDGIGEIVVFIEDLEETWSRAQEARQVFVGAAEALFEFVATFPAPVEMLWDFSTSPTKRLLWQTEFIRIDEDSPGGRRGRGTTNHCVHGKGSIKEEILDWHPYRYYTQRMLLPMIGPLIQTVEFSSLGDRESEMRIRFGPLRGKQRLLWAGMRRILSKGIQDNADRLDQALREELASKSLESEKQT